MIQHKGQLVVCTLENAEMDIQTLRALFRAALRQLGD
jgi:hypothetical protein